MKKILLIISTLFSFNAFAAAAPSMAGDVDPELSYVTKKAITENPMIAAEYEKGVARRTAQLEWLQQLQRGITEASPDVEKLEASVAARIEAEKENYALFETARERAKAARAKEGSRQLTFVLRTAKVGLNLDLADISRLASLIDGDDRVFTADPTEIPYADTGKLFVSSEGRTAITLLQMAYLEATRQTDLEATRQTDLNSAMAGLFGADWLRRSPWHMGVPVPEDVTWDDMERLSSLGHIEGRSILFETGNGYGFGASHGDEGPEAELSGIYPWFDCSSRVWAATGQTSGAPSTLHWWLHSVEGMTKRPFSSIEVVVAAWDPIMSDWRGAGDAVYRDPLVAGFNPVHFESPDEFMPGMVWVRRGMKEDKIAQNPSVALYGAGGHTGIVLGKVGSAEDTRIVVDTANRAMRESNGYDRDYAYGIETHPLYGTESQQLLFALKNNS